MTVTQYAAKIIELSYFALVYLWNLADQFQKFEDGLWVDIRFWVAIMKIHDYSELLEREKLA